MRCPTVKYNRRVRAGRGFTLTELKVRIDCAIPIPSPLASKGQDKPVSLRPLDRKKPEREEKKRVMRFFLVLTNPTGGRYLQVPGSHHRYLCRLPPTEPERGEPCRQRRPPQGLQGAPHPPPPQVQRPQEG